MLPEIIIPGVVPYSAGCYSPSVFPREFPRLSQGICRGNRPAEFITWHKPTKEMGRCFVKRVLYLLDGSKCSY